MVSLKSTERTLDYYSPKNHYSDSIPNVECKFTYCMRPDLIMARSAYHT